MRLVKVAGAQAYPLPSFNSGEAAYVISGCILPDCAEDVDVGSTSASSWFSAIMHSVVKSRPATDAAFCSALRTTLVGSMMPAFIRSSNSSDAALKPKDPLLFLILSTTTEPSQPALPAIQRHGSSSALLM